MRENTVLYLIIMENLKVADEKKNYILSTVNPLLEELMTELLVSTPKRPEALIMELLWRRLDETERQELRARLGESIGYPSDGGGGQAAQAEAAPAAEESPPAEEAPPAPAEPAEAASAEEGGAESAEAAEGAAAPEEPAAATEDPAEAAPAAAEEPPAEAPAEPPAEAAAEDPAEPE